MHNEVDVMKKGADSTGKVMHIIKELLVICFNEVNTDGQAMVTTDEWVLHVD